MGLGEKVLQTYAWMTATKQREACTNFAIASGSAAFKAWWVHHVDPTHQKVINSPPELTAIISAFVYPYVTLSSFIPAVKRAASNMGVSLKTAAFVGTYTLAEYIAFRATGMQYPGKAIIPSIVFGLPSTAALAYCARNEGSVPEQLLNIGKGVGKIVYNSGRKIGNILTNTEEPELPMHEFYQEEIMEE